MILCCHLGPQKELNLNDKIHNTSVIIDNYTEIINELPLPFELELSYGQETSDESP